MAQRSGGGEQHGRELKHCNPGGRLAGLQLPGAIAAASDYGSGAAFGALYCCERTQHCVLVVLRAQE